VVVVVPDWVVEPIICSPPTNGCLAKLAIPTVAGTQEVDRAATPTDPTAAGAQEAA